MQQLEPTPEHFARAYAQEAGQPVAEPGVPARARPQLERLAARWPEARDDIVAALCDGRYDDLQRTLDRASAGGAGQASAWATLIERLARGLERGGRHWTGARKKQSLQRVLDGSRSDATRLQQRLGQLLNAWDDDKPAADVEPSGLAPLDEATDGPAHRKPCAAAIGEPRPRQPRGAEFAAASTAPGAWCCMRCAARWPARCRANGPTRRRWPTRWPMSRNAWPSRGPTSRW